MADPYPTSDPGPQEVGDMGVHDGEVFKRLPVGDDDGGDGQGQVLESSSAATNGQGLLWQKKTPLTDKGDLMVMSGIPARLPKGSEGQVLVVRAAEVTFNQQYESPSLFLWDTIKSGVLSAVAHDTLTTHTFGTAFASTPQVVAILGADPGAVLERLWVEQVTTTGFKVQFKLATPAAKDIQWFATLMGDA